MPCAGTSPFGWVDAPGMEKDPARLQKEGAGAIGSVRNHPEIADRMELIIRHRPQRRNLPRSARCGHRESQDQARTKKGQNHRVSTPQPLPADDVCRVCGG